MSTFKNNKARPKFTGSYKKKCVYQQTDPDFSRMPSFWFTLERDILQLASVIPLLIPLFRLATERNALPHVSLLPLFPPLL